MTEKEMVIQNHCNPELHTGACEYATYTEDDPMCQRCAEQYISDLRATRAKNGGTND